MSTVESVVELFLQKLADPFIQEVISSHGVCDRVELLKAEFRVMGCFLKDADAKQEAGDERVKNWLRAVRDAAYDAENVIDTFVFKVAALRRRGFAVCIRRYTFVLNELLSRYKLISVITRINHNIRALSERRLAYGIQNLGQGAAETSSAHRSLQQLRHTSPFVEGPDFVGFEEDLKALVTRLTDGELRRCVVSVVGMGGLGKTTLTMKVYNTDSVKKHFHTHAWIYVSQEFVVRDLLLGIMNCYKRLPEDDLKNMDIFQLSDQIFQCLKERRYLIVLDDIWAMEAWDCLKGAFPDMNNGSRIMLTTRNKDIALHADARSQPHELRFLNKEEGWNLFCKKTFPAQDGGYPQDLEKLGREIVEKCHGLPLAITVIGGLLSRKDPREWAKVYTSISWVLTQGESIISGVLSMTYRDLSSNLKPCFLYLANFPEDHAFGTKELIQMWAAEGLLQVRGVETLEEAGEDCLKELVQRSIVQVTRTSSSGRIKSCRINAILRFLSQCEAKEGLFMNVHDRSCNDFARCTARRLAIHHDNLSNYISLKSSTPHLNAVFIYTRGHEWLRKEQEEFLYSGFKLLKVLHLHGAQIKELPREIGRLILLRYLGCTKTSLKSLPSSIANLPNLQTLHITSRSEIKLHSAVIQMQRLRHFQVKGVLESNYFDWTGRWGVIEGHPRLDQTSNLQTLSYVKAGKWMEGCLGNFTKLRKLGIVLATEADAKVLYESIANLKALRSLSVVTLADVHGTIGLLVPPLSDLPKLSKLRLEGKLERLPESTEFARNLTKLTLAFSYLKKDPLATLEKLENLRILRLLGASYTGKEMVCAAHGFRWLESLHLEELDQLEQWSVERRAMPSLLHLRIDKCRHLKMLPTGLQFVTTLKNLELWNMHDEFKARLRGDLGEDWHKIHHIPSIDIHY